MNQDKIHDALNLLDDSMIEAVEKLRNNTNRKRLPMYWISAAACLCIAVAILFTAGRIVQLLFDVQNGETLLEDYDYDALANAETGFTDESSEMHFHSLLVQITAWQKNGFTGTVTDILNTDIYAVGTELTILFSDDISYFPESGGGDICYESAPTSTDFPVGSTVWVKFYEAAEDVPETEATEPVLYAKSIGPASMAIAPTDTTTSKGRYK